MYLEYINSVSTAHIIDIFLMYIFEISHCLVIYIYNVQLCYFQTVNKVLLAYADIVKRDFEKYTHRQKIVSFY